MRKQTNRVLKVIGVGIIGILAIITGICMYLFLVDIESKVPEEMKWAYSIEEKTFQNRKVFVIQPKGENIHKVIFYLHGGSYMAETSDKHWKFLQDLVSDTGATVILPDYPLTPKYNYKDVYLMIYPLYQEIIEKIEDKSIIIMGDSAGGGMALALTQELGKQGEKMPKRTILISPWLDVTLKNPVISKVQKYDKQLHKEALILAGMAYAGEDGMENCWVNPINGPMQDLENVIIFTGTYDILHPDTHILVEKAKRQGVYIQLKEYERQPHIWLLERGEHKTQEEEKAYQDLINCVLEE